MIDSRALAPCRFIRSAPIEYNPEVLVITNSAAVGAP
jgi:hypothetical protein